MTPSPEDPAGRYVSVVTEGGVALVRKTFTRPGEARFEARWLAEAHHPGVVRLVAHTDRHLDTELVVGPTLRTAAVAPGTAAAVLASVARTLAELHDRGLAHANLSPDHILVVSAADAVGAPLARLCSPRGSSAMDPGPRSARHDDHRMHGCPDSAGLGRCVRWLVDDWNSREVPVPRAWAELGALVEAQGERLTMRRLLRRIEALCPLPLHRTVPQRPVPDRPAPPMRSVGWRSLSIVLLIALSGLAISRPGGATRAHRISDARSADAVTDLAAPIVLDGTRYLLDGQDPRAFVTANVDRPCPGQPRLLVLEVGTDVVWAFHDIGDQAEAVALGRVAGATGLDVEAGDAPDECPRLWATGPVGRADLSGSQP
jgi:hypothetical protein